MTSFLRRLIIYGTDNGLAALFGISVLSVAAIKYDAATVGNLALSIAVVTVLQPIAAIGLPNLIYARVAARAGGASAGLLRLAIPVFGLGGLVYLLVGGGIFLIDGSGFLWLYMICGIRLPFAFGELIRSKYRGKNQPEAYIRYRIISLALAFCMLCGVYFSDAGPLFLAGVWTAEWVVFACLLFLAARRVAARLPSVRTLATSVNKSSGLMLQALMVSVYYRFDQIYVGQFFEAGDLAVYSIGARFAEAGNMAFSLIGLTFGPRIVAEWHRGSLSGAAKFLLLGVALCSVGLSIGAYYGGDELLTWMIGPDYAASRDIMAVYFLSTCFTVYGFLGTQMVVASGRLRAPFYSGLAGALSCVVLTILICSFAGPVGAAYATVASYGIAAGILWLTAIIAKRTNA